MVSTTDTKGTRLKVRSGSFSVFAHKGRETGYEAETMGCTAAGGIGGSCLAAVGHIAVDAAGWCTGRCQRSRQGNPTVFTA